ncbi:MAG: ABC-type multidrug transport system fused ATPase/permease subunit [Oceanicoccus sp.]|jgi:ABC-type multidrug transport system fused ATPase/permease subunit
MKNISIKNIILRFKWRIAFTFLLILLGAVLEIFIPLVIGLAIDGLLQGSNRGVVQLGILGVATLIIGTAQRFYDTRIYASIYCQITPELVLAEQERGSVVSTISARTGLLTEIVEFLENSMPLVVNSTIALVGSLVLIAALDFTVFLACLILLLLVVIIYSLTGKFNYSLNARYNDQLEKQVSVLEKKDARITERHFTTLMHWNIKLSDLETVNYFFIWLGVIALLIFTPITVISAGVIEYGLVFSLLMYVLAYIESLINCPLFIQQLIRLHEISVRLSSGSVKENQGESCV